MLLLPLIGGGVAILNLKWSHPFTLSSSMTVRSEVNEGGVESSVPVRKETSPLPSDECIPRKRRLGWGQGLVKYENQLKAEESVKCDNNGKASGLSPADLEDKTLTKEANNSTRWLQNCLAEVCSKLNTLEVDTSGILTPLLANLLQPKDACSDDSSFTSHAHMNKLLAIKGLITEEFERTDCDIVLFENELKTLNDDEKNDPCQSSFALQAGCASGPCVQLANVASMVPVDFIPSKDLVLASAETECSFHGGERPATVCGLGDGNCLDGENRLIALIMAANRDAAREASQLLDRASAVDSPEFDVWGSDFVVSCTKNEVRIKETFFMRKSVLKLEDRVHTLKCKAFHHLWYEDLCSLSTRNHQPKSQSERHRSSICSYSILPAGNLNLVPTVETVDYTSKVLSDSHTKLYTDNLKMPPLINGLVENPPTFEKERALIDPSTQDEKKVFVEMLATHGKDFAKISSSLDHKNTADCIEFYNKRHELESFREVWLNPRKQWKQRIPTDTGPIASAKKWNRAAPLDTLGTRDRKRYSGRSVTGTRHRSSRVSLGGYFSPAMAEILRHESETDDPAEKTNYVAVDRSLTPEVTWIIDGEGTCSDESCGELNLVDWTDEERSVFIKAFRSYGKDFARISRSVGTRSIEQCKVFFSKARKCLCLDVMIHPGPCNAGPPRSGGTNGGGGDTDSESEPSSVQYEVGRSNQEEMEAKIDGFALVKDGEIFRSDGIARQIGDASLRCDEPVRFREVAEDFIDGKTEEGGNGLLSSPVKLVVPACVDVDQLKSHPNQPEASLRPCFQSSSREIEAAPHRTGVIKLFGKIIGYRSSLQESSSSLQESDSQPPA